MKKGSLKPYQDTVCDVLVSFPASESLHPDGSTQIWGQAMIEETLDDSETATWIDGAQARSIVQDATLGLAIPLKDYKSTNLK